MNDATSGLIDIIEPTAPLVSTSSLPYIWLAVALALLLLVSSAIWWRRQRCQRAARKRLRQLQHKLQAGNISQQQAAYALASELAQAYRLRQLQADQPPQPLPPTLHADWTTLLNTLDQLRYQADASMDTASWSQLFTVADTCLRRSGPC